MSIVKVGIGHSTDAREAAEAAMQSTPKPDLVIVFSGFGLDPNASYQAVREVVGEAPIIGGTSTGEFSSVIEAPQTDSVAVMTLQSSYISVGVGVGGNLGAEPEACAQEAIANAYQALKPNPAVMALTTIAMDSKGASDVSRIKPYVNIVLPDGSKAREEAFLRGLIRETGSVAQIVGGSPGNDFKADKTYQFGNGVFEDSAVIATLSSGLKMGTSMGHPYFPSNKGAVVTRSSDRVVHELDGRPAADVIREIIGSQELDADVFAKNPFGIKSSDVFGEYTIKSAAEVHADGSVSFLAEIPEGAYLRYMQSERGYAIASFKSTLEKAIIDAGSPKKIGAIIIFNCILRHLLKCRLEINDLEIIHEVAGEVPMIGFNTFGEQGATLGGSVGHYNQTATILVIADEMISQ